MSLEVAVDIEATIVDFLKAQTELTTLVSTRVHTDLPAAPTYPLVRVGRIGGIGRYPAHIDRPRVQCEAFADTKASAHDVAATARALLLTRFAGVHGSAVVTDVSEDGGLIWLPDPAGTPGIPARPRYLFAVAVTVHPA